MIATVGCAIDVLIGSTSASDSGDSDFFCYDRGSYCHYEAEGVCTAEETEEAVRVASDLVVQREGAQAEEEYDRAAAEKSSGCDALFHRATLGASS
ncbi:hypothetical protein KIN20_024237 [Parelaphostrongylus tenuis]|uniref:Uncharacterized protein n=1 Tax=Parelaphostrongylus tenuis TaxID=148309 RepID=A0AAD5N7D5_PARTN|nr:hypothetical protein KIN20_024237 [Parelaphostrongylus tenuis]